MGIALQVLASQDLDLLYSQFIQKLSCFLILDPCSSVAINTLLGVPLSETLLFMWLVSMQISLPVP